jgi:hypothetical protein
MLKMDFTINIYIQLLESLSNTGHYFQTFSEFVKYPKNKVVILRHDVDLMPQKSKQFAKIQAEKCIKGSYYFRAVPESWNEEVIKGIASMGHEIGYHYETMDTANGEIDIAWDQFRYHLDKLRKIVDVKTICMHGSPRSKYDNRDIWKKYDYGTLGIVGEPYYDIDFEKMLYLTDTGRRWDGWKTAVRDKVPQQKAWIEQDLVFHSTNEIIETVEKAKFPNQAMFTCHPQRWHNEAFPWTKELLAQSLKNYVKKYLFVK